MKKYLSLVMIGLSLMLSGCSKDDNNNPDTPPTGDTGKLSIELIPFLPTQAGNRERI